jgi:hypothetical protein
MSGRGNVAIDVVAVNELSGLFAFDRAAGVDRRGSGSHANILPPGAMSWQKLRHRLLRLLGFRPVV